MVTTVKPEKVGFCPWCGEENSESSQDRRQLDARRSSCFFPKESFGSERTPAAPHQYGAHASAEEAAWRCLRGRGHPALGQGTGLKELARRSRTVSRVGVSGRGGGLQSPVLEDKSRGPEGCGSSFTEATPAPSQAPAENEWKATVHRHPPPAGLPAPAGNLRNSKCRRFALPSPPLS